MLNVHTFGTFLFNIVLYSDTDAFILKSQLSDPVLYLTLISKYQCVAKHNGANYLKASRYKSQDNFSICLQTIVSKSFKKNHCKD